MKFTLKQIRKVILCLIFLFLAGAIGFKLGEKKETFFKKPVAQILTTPSAKNIDLSLFWQVWGRLEENYLDRKDIDRNKMLNGAISGMVASLGDPYTVFLPQKDNEATKSDLRGDFEGVGIQIGYNKDQRLAVIAPLSGTPADAAGVKAGDLILKIVDEKNKVDKDTAGIALPEAVDLIRGPKGSTVKLTMARVGVEKPFDVSLRRDTIVVKSVELSFKEQKGKKVAFLKLTRFGERTYDEWSEAVSKIKSEEVSNNNFGGIILDLRNNPGGFLQGAVFIASEFISSGTVVQQDKGVNGKDGYSVDRKGSLLSEPLVVLINGGSASASEIVAGAVQETQRAKLVGEKSFGKGTVQEAEDLSGGAGLHVTVARWLLPSGKSIDKEGVKPDVEVKPDEKDMTKDLQLDKAIEVLLK